MIKIIPQSNSTKTYFFEGVIINVTPSFFANNYFGSDFNLNSTLLMTFPDAVKTFTCHLPDHSSIIIFELQVRHVSDFTGRSTFAFEVSWLNGDRIISDECRVQRKPDITDGQRPSDRVWTVFLRDADYLFAAGSRV